MTSLQSPPEVIHTLADLLDRLGGIPLSRVRFVPAPGTATEEDVIVSERRQNHLCELVDGVLVEKAMGFREACLAGVILSLLRDFVVPRNLGLVAGADGTLRLFPGLVRIPDVAFVSWDRVPGGTMPVEPLPQLAPEFVVEVLSPSNTDAEMDRKRREYFAAGALIVWIIDPVTRTISVYASPQKCTVYSEQQTVEIGSFLPGLRIQLRDVFAELDRRKPE